MSVDMQISCITETRPLGDRRLPVSRFVVVCRSTNKGGGGLCLGKGCVPLNPERRRGEVWPTSTLPESSLLLRRMVDTRSTRLYIIYIMRNLSCGGGGPETASPGRIRIIGYMSRRGPRCPATDEVASRCCGKPRTVFQRFVKPRGRSHPSRSDANGLLPPLAVPTAEGAVGPLGSLKKAQPRLGFKSDREDRGVRATCAAARSYPDRSC